MSDTVLTYLPVKARAEGIMIALNLAHVPFTNRTTVKLARAERRVDQERIFAFWSTACSSY